MSNQQLVMTRHDLWPVVLWKIELPDFEAHNVRMLAAIGELRAEHPEGARGRSNPLGWQSPKRLQQLPAFQPLLGIAVDALVNPIAAHFNWDVSNVVVSIESWANVNPPGSLNKIHAHAGALLSGAYYIDVPEQSGGICFYNPRKIFQHDDDPPALSLQATSPNGLSHLVRPKPGQLLLFPGWLPHEVEPNLNSEQTRYSISFNLTLNPAPAR